MKQQLLEKLQKVLRLADHPSATPGEREAAIMRATQMAEKMGVELAFIRAKNEESAQEDAVEEIVKEDLATQMKEKHGWHIFTMRIVALMCDLKWVYRQYKYENRMEITMVGEKSDIVFGQYLFGYFNSAIEQQWEISRKAIGLKHSEKKAFWAGAVRSIESKINIAKAQARAAAMSEVAKEATEEVVKKVASTRELMVVEKQERVETAYNEFFDKVRKGCPSRGFSDKRHLAIAAGRRAGANVAIPGRPLGNSSQNSLR